MWKPEVPAMEANADRGIEAHNTIPGEDNDNLDDVFATFDEHFGVHHYRSIKRQDFPKTKHDDKQSLMSFISSADPKVSSAELMVLLICPSSSVRQLLL